MKPDGELEIRLTGHKSFKAMFFLNGSRRDDWGIPVSTEKIPPQEAACLGILKDKIMSFVDIFCDGVAKGTNKE